MNVGQDSRILGEYDEHSLLYQTFVEKIQVLIGDLLEAEGIRVHSIGGRLKQRDNLAEKLSRPGASYASLTDVTDIAGVRIITYFEDEVDRVSSVIEREFVIDVENSIDKRKALDPDQFGYMSVHYVANLAQSRSALGEYARFATCKIEIQVRSILQHAWAEIEHDLGYKNPESIPREVRRRFSRLAGLLETADAEFVSIREVVAGYLQAVTEQIQSGSIDVPIDKESLAAFLDSGALDDYDRRIANNAKAKLEAAEGINGALPKFLNRAGFDTIEDVKLWLQGNASLLQAFLEVSHWVDQEPSETGIRGLSLLPLLDLSSLLRAEERGVNHFEELRKVFEGISQESADALHAMLEKARGTTNPM